MGFDFGGMAARQVIAFHGRVIYRFFPERLMKGFFIFNILVIERKGMRWICTVCNRFIFN